MAASDGAGRGWRPDQGSSPFSGPGQPSIGDSQGGWQTRGPFELPAQFGVYRIKSKLGAGGMGSVYLVENTELQRDEALKVPHFEGMNDPALVERFLREARAAARLEHPNLCPVYHVGVHDGVIFMTMRYLKGTPLSRFSGRAIPAVKAVEIVLALARALEYAHGQGIVHRDLKPSNVMLCPGTGPTIMDFGLAKQTFTADDRLTRTGTVMGTPHYMPPEQVKGEQHLIGPQCDVYSLGVILFELLTGQLPFIGSQAEVIGKLLYQAAPAPSQLLPGLDRSFDAICARALAKLPSQRFASMKVFAAALSDPRHASTSASGETLALPATPAGQLPQSTPTSREELLEMPTMLPGQTVLTTSPPLAQYAEPPPQARVTCPRCNSRIRVKDPSRLGRVIDCPTCQNTVPSVLDAEPVDAVQVPAPRRTSPPRDRRSSPPPQAVPRAGGGGGGWVLLFVLIGGFALLGAGLVAFVLLSPRLFSPDTKPTAEQTQNQADKLYREGMEALTGMNKEVDHPRALTLFRQAEDKGNVVARGRIGLMTYRGHGVEPNPDEGLRLIREALPAVSKAAEEGNVDAQVLYGTLLQEGLGCDRDAVKASQLYARAAEKGEPTAMNNLGVAYARGEGFGVADEKKAVEWYQKAADKGHAIAMRNLGATYENGRGVEQSSSKAIEWYARAADKGDELAMLNLATTYANGRGVVQDARKAMDYYTRAAEKGNPTAMLELGNAYLSGFGVTQDAGKAAEWYRKGADKGNAQAANNLGYCYEEGRGVVKDENQALRWYGKAASQGLQSAQQSKRRLELIRALMGKWTSAGVNLEVTRERYTFTAAEDYALTLNTTVEPPTLDLREVGPQSQGRTWCGIFRVEGDTLTVSYNTGNGQYPTSFDGLGKGNNVVYTRVR